MKCYVMNDKLYAYLLIPVDFFLMANANTECGRYIALVYVRDNQRLAVH